MKTSLVEKHIDRKFPKQSYKIPQPQKAPVAHNSSDKKQEDTSSSRTGFYKEKSLSSEICANSLWLSIPKHLWDQRTGWDALKVTVQPSCTPVLVWGGNSSCTSRYRETHKHAWELVSHWQSPVIPTQLARMLSGDSGVTALAPISAIQKKWTNHRGHDQRV